VNGNAQPYAWMTYAEAVKRASNAGSAFMSLGVKKGGAVGVYSSNCPEWMLALKAIDFCGAQCVPLYDTFGPDAVKFIIRHSGLTVLCTASDNLKALLPILPDLADQLVQVIVWSSSSGNTAEEAVSSVCLPSVDCIRSKCWVP
jgi:long-chain acyl-CoA synthetase